MRFIVWLIVLFVVAVVAAGLLGTNDGLVTVNFRHWRIELSLNLFLLLVAGTCLAIMATMRTVDSLVTLPRRARDWRALQRERAAQRALREALAEYFGARYGRAHKAAERALTLQEGTPALVDDADFRILSQLVATASLHRLQDHPRRQEAIERLTSLVASQPARSVSEGSRLMMVEWALDDREADIAVRRRENAVHGLAGALELRMTADGTPAGVLAAGWPITVPATTVNRLCGSGQQQQTRGCVESPCFGTCTAEFRSIPCTGSGDARSWGSWYNVGGCSTACGEGDQDQARVCSGDCGSCAGSSTRSLSCSRGGQKDWSAWTKSGGCSNQCGSGTQTMVRSCDGCLGSCSWISTKEVPCSVGDPRSWTSWVKSGTCSTNCGSGQQLLVRTCSGTCGDCPGASSMSVDCAEGVAKAWTAWTDSGECSTTCGSGTKPQTRACDGCVGSCPGAGTQNVACTGGPARSWSAWQDAGVCNTVCGTGTQQAGPAHVDADVGRDLISAVDDHCPGAGQRSDHELVARLQPAGPEIVREHPRAVAAHLRGRAIAVAVVHEPVPRTHTCRQMVQHSRGDGGTRGGHPQHPVRTETAATIAQGSHRLRSQLQPGRQVDKNHEIVLGAVPFGENHQLRIRDASARPRPRADRSSIRRASGCGHRVGTTTAAGARSGGYR
jgi:hypothetical protein